MAPVNISRLFQRFEESKQQDEMKQNTEDLKKLAEKKGSEIKFNQGTKSSGFSNLG